MAGTQHRATHLDGPAPVPGGTAAGPGTTSADPPTSPGPVVRSAAGALRLVGRLGPTFGARAADRAVQLAGRRCPPLSVRARRRGLTWDLDLDDNIQRTLYFTGVYDPLLLRSLRAELRRGDVFYDIGANIGVIAVPVARVLQRLGGGRVHAIEPAAANATKLRRHAARNGVAEVVHVAQQAFGRAPGSVPLRASSAFGVGDCGTWSQYGDGPVVAQAPLERGDDYVQRTGAVPTVVKVDVEGAELDVLTGLAGTLEHARPRLVVVELVDAHQARAGGTTAEVVELLHGLGYAPQPRSRRPARGDGRPLGNVAFRPVAPTR